MEQLEDPEMPGQLASVGAGDRHLLWECPLLGGHGVSVGENADLVLLPRTRCRRDKQRMRSVGPEIEQRIYNHMV
jgi:hypothetical protein